MRRIAFALLLFLVSVAGVNVPVNTSVLSATIVQGSISYSPASPRQSQDLTITVTLNNTGNVNLSGLNATVMVWNASGNLKIYDSNQSTTSTIAALEAFSFSVTVAMGSNAVGNYSINVTAYAGNDPGFATPLANVSRNFTLSAGTAPSTGTQADGSTTAVYVFESSKLVFEDILLSSILEPGETSQLEVRLFNKGNSGAEAECKLEGGIKSWSERLLVPQIILAKQFGDCSFDIKVPIATEPGRYAAKLDVSDKGAPAASVFAVVQVRSYPENYALPRVVRSIYINPSENSTLVRLRVANPGRAKLLSITERIPKQAAPDLRLVNFSIAPEVLEADPVVRWDLANLSTNMSLNYTIANFANDLLLYMAWPSEEVTAIIKPELNKLEITDFSTTTPTSDNEMNAVVGIRNTWSSQLPVSIQLMASNNGISISPDSYNLTLPSGFEDRKVFRIRLPRDFLGQFSLRLLVIYPEGFLEKELIVGPRKYSPEVIPQLGADQFANIIVLVLLACIMVLVFKLANPTRKKKRVKCPPRRWRKFH